MKRFLLFSITFIVFATPATAQTAPCNLRLDVYPFQEKVENEPVEIKNVSAFLQLEKTKTKIKPSPQNETNNFANLPAGNYTATVSMNGYKTTTKEITLNCSSANEQSVVSEVIFLREGNAEEIFKMTDAAFAAVGGQSKESTKPSEGYNAEPSENSVNKNAAYLPKPVYPPAARAVKAMGLVQVEVLIDEIGRVVSAKAVNGHPLLRASAVKAAKEAKFGQTRLQGIPVKVSGIIDYNFVP